MGFAEKFPVLSQKYGFLNYAPVTLKRVYYQNLLPFHGVLKLVMSALTGMCMKPYTGAVQCITELFLALQPCKKITQIYQRKY